MIGHWLTGTLSTSISVAGSGGTLQGVLTRYGPELAPGWHFLDSSYVKVSGDGSNPAGGQTAHAMGRTKGGLNTKIHAVINARSQAPVVALSSGIRADVTWLKSFQNFCHKVLS